MKSKSISYPTNGLRPYQHDAFWHLYEGMQAKRNVLIVSPTGTGKSHIKIKLHQHMLMRGCIVTPNIEIIKGIVSKLTGGRLEKNVQEQGEALNVWTPIRLLRHGPRKIDYLLIDEAHHDAADTYTKLYERYPVPRGGLTATNYRGTVKETDAFLRNWDETHTVLTWSDAAEQGFISVPDVHTIPLVDDDLIELKNGELNLVQLEAATRSTYKSALQEIEKFKCYGYQDEAKDSFRTPYRPLVCTFPSVATASEYSEYIDAKGYPSHVITAETPQETRDKYLKWTVQCGATLCQIRTIGEGVDLPLRIGCDFAPTLSPVKFIQLFGRFCRPVKPGEAKPLYLCFNRNLQHHGYILKDILPPTTFKEVNEVFGSPGTRAGYRFAGIQTFGKIKPSELRTLSGDFVHLYLVQGTKERFGDQYRMAAVLDPYEAEPYWFRSQMPRGKWERIPQPMELEATASHYNGSLTDPMQNWWNKDAKKVGLDPDQPIDVRKFQLLPILRDCRLSLR